MMNAALIVDDEDLVRNLFVDVLRSLNFDTIQADNEEKAWIRYLERETDIAFVITEIHLLRGSGLSLYHRIRSRNREVMVVVCCDYPDFPSDMILQDPYAALLIKPFPIESLIRIASRLSPKKEQKMISVA